MPTSIKARTIGSLFCFEMSRHVLPFFKQSSWLVLAHTIPQEAIALFEKEKTAASVANGGPPIVAAEAEKASHRPRLAFPLPPRTSMVVWSLHKQLMEASLLHWRVCFRAVHTWRALFASLSGMGSPVNIKNIPLMLDHAAVYTLQVELYGLYPPIEKMDASLASLKSCKCGRI